MKIAYGIDFGTSNSTVAVTNAAGNVSKILIDKDSENPTVMRSIIYVNENLDFQYGQSAIDAYNKDISEGKGRVRKTVYTGRFITVAGDADIQGVRPDEVVEELIEFDEFQGGRMLQSLKSILSNENVTGINLFGRKIAIEEILGGFLKEMKLRADREVGHDAKAVVIGRPVRYVGNKDDNLAVQRVEKAARLAGFKQIKFEYEPIAASYDYNNRITSPQTVLVFDFGGGTLDVSVVKFPQKKVLSNLGIPLGGDVFNSDIFTAKLAPFFGSKSTYGQSHLNMPGYLYLSLRNWYEATLLKDENFDERMNYFRFMNSNPRTIDSLRSLVNNNLSFSLYNEIDRVKRNLSYNSTEKLKFIADHINIETSLEKKEFEILVQAYIPEIDELLERALTTASVGAGDIDAIATTGGSSLIPLIRNFLANKFGKEKIIESDAFTSVAAGLSLRAQEVFN